MHELQVGKNSQRTDSHAETTGSHKDEMRQLARKCLVKLGSVHDFLWGGGAICVFIFFLSPASPLLALTIQLLHSIQFCFFRELGIIQTKYGLHSDMAMSLWGPGSRM